MSVILNALRSKEASKATSDRKIWPKEGLFIDREKTESLSSATRLSILITILFVASIAAVVRLTGLYFATQTAKSTVSSPIATAPALGLGLPAAPPAVPKSDLEGAKSLFNQNRAEESLAAYEQLVKANPSNAMALNDMGFILLKQNRVIDAESKLQAAIKADPSCAECYNNMGMLATQMGRIKEAEKYLMHAIELKESYPDPHFNLAVLLQKSGDEKTAMIHFEDFLKWTPNKNAPIVQQVKGLLAKMDVNNIPNGDR